MMKNAWLPLALVVLVTPWAMGLGLDRLAPASERSEAVFQPPPDGISLQRLPNAMPVQVPNSGLSEVHAQVRPQTYISFYQHQLSNDGEGLVPYLPRLYSNSDFTLVEAVTADIDGQPYAVNRYRRRLNNQYFISLHQFKVGDFYTESYTRAKLYQLPAAFLGAQKFSLRVWQQPCTKASCEAERQQIEALVSAQG